MSREFSVRVSPELAQWVRSQGASPTRVLAGILRAVQDGRLTLKSRDPGPGTERFTVRVPKWALPYVREAGHSHKPLVAIRRIFQAGFELSKAPSLDAPKVVRSRGYQESRATEKIVPVPNAGQIQPRFQALPIAARSDRLSGPSLKLSRRPRKVSWRTLDGQIIEVKASPPVGPGRHLEPVATVLRERGVVVFGAPGIRWPGFG